MRKGKFEDEYVEALKKIEWLEVRLLSAGLVRQEAQAEVAELEKWIIEAVDPLDLAPQYRDKWYELREKSHPERYK